MPDLTCEAKPTPVCKALRIALAALRKIKRIRKPYDEEYEIAVNALKRIAKAKGQS